MASNKLEFGWKRKAAVATTSALYEPNENDEQLEEQEVDWLTATKKPKVLLLEDSSGKAERLKAEGVALAESEKWWAAIGKWNSSLSYHDDAAVHEMLAQAYMHVCEVYPALGSAESAVRLDPTWWVGYQTLGRTQLGLGEVDLAVKSFSRAIHLQPDQLEIWQDDLAWAVNLVQKRRELQIPVVSNHDSTQNTVFTNEPTCIMEEQIDIKHRKEIDITESEHSEDESDHSDFESRKKENEIDINKMIKMRFK